MQGEGCKVDWLARRVTRMGGTAHPKWLGACGDSDEHGILPSSMHPLSTCAQILP